MSESEAFHWQQKYTPWKNPGIYHVTVTVTPKEPVLGSLCIPTTNNIPNPEEATIIRTDLGREVVHCVAQIAELHPEIRLLKYCLMPDHVHFILQVTQPMEISIRTVLRGFQTGCRKAARCVGLDGASLFSEAPYIRSLSHAGQLQNMFRYIEDNPRRLAVKKLFPGFLRTMRDIEIGESSFDAVGNVLLLQSASYGTVHVRHDLVNMAKVGQDVPLRAYMNGCLASARAGAVLISPFVSSYEQAVLKELVKENLPVIYLLDNGFSPYYKPSGLLINACARGSALLLAPRTYDEAPGRIKRAQCVALNSVAERLAQILGCRMNKTT